MPTDLVADFSAFLQACPTSYHAVAELAARLRAAGFTEQRETGAFDVTPGGHYIVRDGALIAYRVPRSVGEDTSLRIVGTHTDSPSFKLKPAPEHAGPGFRQAGAEVYGGPLFNAWLDRDLALAGRIVLADGTTRLVRTPAWLRIPQLAPHLDHSVNDQLHLDPQAHLMPVYALDGDGPDLFGALTRQEGLAGDDICGHDLFLVTTEPPAVIGVAGEFLAARRLDNLSSVYPGLVALLEADPSADVLPVLACFDHEEIGSGSTTGASGPFLASVLERCCLALGITGDAVHRLYARSWVVSADAGHAVNPNYPTLHDPDERPRLNGGPMLKVNAKQRYTTDGPGEALWRRVCRAADVPVQVFVSNNAVPCGTTIGPLTATRLGIRTVDVGLPLLSMHSTRELVGVDDPARLARALQAFYELG